MRGLITTTILSVFLCGCDTPPQVPVEVTDITVYAPLPGSKMSAAYFQLHNHTDQSLVLRRLSSPQFTSVEIHETTLDDGVSRMHKLERLVVPAKSSVSLREGGKHLMLIGPKSPLTLDSTVSISIGYGDDGTLIVSAPLRARFQLEESN